MEALISLQRIGVDSESNAGVAQVLPQHVCPVVRANYNNKSFNATIAEIVDAGFDYSFRAEGKKWFERAHGVPSARRRVGWQRPQWPRAFGLWS